VADSPVSPRRLVIVVVLVAAAVGAALATVVFELVRDARLRDSLERARAEAVFDLRLAGPLLEGSTNLQQAVATFREERGIHAILIKDGQTVDTDPTLGITIPPALRDLAARGQLGFDRVDVGGGPTLIVGGPTPDREAELYFAFSESRIDDDLRQLGTTLAIGWAAIVVISFALARVAAGRIASLAEAEAWGRRFTSDVSHELRTPVAALVSEAAVLEEHLDGMPPEARRAAELLVGDVARMRKLVEDLTNLASMDAGREEVRVESFDLGALIEGTVRSRGWDGRITIRSDPVEVATDRSRVDRVVANLIGNAIEHGGGDVEVRVGRDQEGPFVEVTDAGRGIAPEHLPHVFDRFYRADAARSGLGTGLGLAIARENARLLGGEIEVTSEPGTGSRFTLRLPQDPSVAEP
jgi:two-component system, OmpR family, sensor histidine kinase MtrB